MPIVTTTIPTTNIQHMKKSVILAIIALGVSTATLSAKPRNYFKELGYSKKEIKAKINAAFHEVFESERSAYKNVGDTLGYVSDVKNHDVRTEGQSYGMMVAVQMDKQDIFNRIWRWSKLYMQVKEAPRLTFALCAAV